MLGRCEASATRGRLAPGPYPGRLGTYLQGRGRVCSTVTQPEEPAVSDKSPRQTSSKKSSKTLKEKRADKKAVANTREHPTVIPTGRSGK